MIEERIAWIYANNLICQLHFALLDSNIVERDKIKLLDFKEYLREYLKCATIFQKWEI